MSLVAANELSIGYDFIIQSGLTFSIKQGDFFWLKGPNGSGKSSLIKVLLQEISPISGSIEYPSGNLHIEHLPQNISYNLPLSITLQEILDAYEVDPHRQHLFPKNKTTQKWSESSGGEKQKVLILTRTAKACDLLILDEPFNHLDQTSIEDLSGFLEDFIETKWVRAILLVSHIKPAFRNSTPLKVLSF